MKSNAVYIGVALSVVVLLVLLTDPFMLWMPPAAAMAALVGAVVLLGAWIAFVAYERVSDEREAALRSHAGHAAYLAGVAVLTAAVLVQGLSHHLDPWVAGALAAMVIAKVAARLLADR